MRGEFTKINKPYKYGHCEYYKHEEFNPDPKVFYGTLAMLCGFDKCHTYGEQTILAGIIRKRCYEYTKLTKLPSLKKPLVKKLICMSRIFRINNVYTERNDESNY